MSDDLLQDDAQTRERFRRGDRAAMTAVYQYYEKLVRTVVRHGFSGFRGFRKPSDQDDMVQTIFLAAFEEQARLRYDGLKPYAAYLRGLAQNKIRQQLSKNTRFARTDGAPVPEDRMAEDMEGVMLESEAHQVVARFREGITDAREAAVLQGYFVEGRAEETLAKELGIESKELNTCLSSDHPSLENKPLMLGLKASHSFSKLTF